MTDTKYAYTFKVEGDTDYATLLWLHDRGYAGNIRNLCELIDEEDEDNTSTYTYGLTEPEAWEFKEYIDDDPDAFLTCCGSKTLADTLIELWLEIV
jgi:hypothetical protein